MALNIPHLFNSSAGVPWSLVWAAYLDDNFASLVAAINQMQSPVTVAQLPSPSDGLRAFVSNSTLAAAGNFGVAVTGGGLNHVPVYYDGGTATWRIG